MFLNNVNKFYFPLSLILILTFSRLIPHPPNFTPIIAASILGGFFFQRLEITITVIFSSLFLTDLVLGLYSSMAFVYTSLVLIIILSNKMSKFLNLKTLLIFGLAGATIFFIFSNFGVWLLSGLYPKNISGLIECYIMAIPFFKNTLMSTILFSYITFIVYKVPSLKKG